MLYSASHASYIKEVDRFDITTGATKLGYICSVGANQMYDSTGKLIY